MTGIQLKVSPEELKRKAEECRKCGSSMESSWNQICRLVETSKSFWEGRAGDRFRHVFKCSRKGAQQMIRRLRGHPDQLLRMAGVYTKAEAEAAAEVSRLPEDVIT